MFSLHPRLAADTITLGDFPLCRVLLMNDSQYPWLILVPRHPDLREVHELPEAEQHQLLRESSWLSKHLGGALKADKMNVANLGNVVDQLHWHVIARFRDDPAWPAPVWGKLPAVPYTEAELAETLDMLRTALPAHGAVPLTWMA